MIHVRLLSLREIRLRLIEPFQTASGTTRERRILLVDVLDRDGLRAWGECVAPETLHYTGESVDTAFPLIVDRLAPVTLASSHESVGDLAAALFAEAPVSPMARAAIEMAAWDLEAQRLGLSLSTLLGGTRDRVETGVVVGLHVSDASLAARVNEAVEAGYRRVKIKIKPGNDVGRVAEARRAAGPGTALAVDANGAYGRADAPTLRALDEYLLSFIEQPLPADNLKGTAELQTLLATPICLDESISSARSAEEMVACGAGRIINLKPGRVGGHREALAIHDIAVANGVPLWCGGMLESGIGRAHNVALASLPGFTMPGDLSPSARYWEHDIVDPSWVMSDGALRVPRDRPGIGVDVDLDRVETLTVRRTEVSA